MRTIKDEQETTWFIGDEDPAAPLCKALAKAGFEEVALPRQAVLTGTVDANFDTSRMDVALAGVSLADRVDKQVRRTLIAAAEHQVRLYLCWRFLSGVSPHTPLR